MTQRAPGGWTPTLFIRGTLALHTLGLLMLALEPALWPWVLGGLAANHVVIGVVVPFPRNALIGANITRLPPDAVARNEIALTFDDGPDPAVTPHVLDLLDAHAMRATFFCIAQNALAHPELVREIVRRGHHVENHSHGHSVGFSLYGYARLSREIDTAQVALYSIANRAPRFFRAPAGIRSPWLDPILQRRGLRYISWTRRGFDAVECDPQRVLLRLTRNLAGGDVLLLHDGGTAQTRDGRPVVLEVLPALLGYMRRCGLKSVTLSDGFLQDNQLVNCKIPQASPGALTTSASAWTGPARSSTRTP
nr:polysaccharide deacetylase family protein [uncultured Dongia sp.]